MPDRRHTLRAIYLLRGENGYRLPPSKHELHPPPLHPPPIFPFEIISIILEQACTVTHSGRTGAPAHIVSPLILRQVCHSWHSFLDKRTFWTALVIPLSCVERPNGIDVERGLLSWIERAGNQQLSVYLDGSSVFQMKPFSVYTEFLVRFLAVSSYRWRLLELHHVPSCLTTTLTEALHPNDLCGLEYLSIRLAPADREVASTLDCSQSKLLRHLSFKGNLFQSIPNVQYNPAQLTSLFLNDAEVLNDTLGRYPNATIINIHPRFHNRGPNSTRVVLAHLNNWTIRANTSTVIRGLLDSTSAPKLKRFSIVLGHQIQHDITIHIIQFIAHSKCSLTHLSLDLPSGDRSVEGHRDDTPLVQMLMDQVQLLELHVKPRNSSLSPLFFNAFNPDNRLTYLPELRIFTYEGPLSFPTFDFLVPLLRRLGRKQHNMLFDWDCHSSGHVAANLSNIVPRLTFVKVKSRQLRQLLQSPFTGQSSPLLNDMKAHAGRGALWLQI